MASQAKKRKTNFSEREVEIIVEEMEKQKHILVNHFNAGVTHIAKNCAWMEILKRVNAVSTCLRELAEVKKKWSDLKTEVRRKVAQARAAMEGTGDCTTVPVILTSMQQRICNLLGEATIISLPAAEAGAEIAVPISSAATVTLTQSKTLALLLRNFKCVESKRARQLLHLLPLYSPGKNTLSHELQVKIDFNYRFHNTTHLVNHSTLKFILYSYFFLKCCFNMQKRYYLNKYTLICSVGCN